MSKAGLKMGLYMIPVMPFAVLMVGNFIVELEKYSQKLGILFGILILLITFFASSAELKCFIAEKP